MEGYEITIGLEVHAEMNTKSKIFCGCKATFGGEANSHCCPVCMGLPGALPVLNQEVVRKAALAGMALKCRINQTSVFDRKNYFYPDLPKAYQISQLYLPICEEGELLLESGRRVRIREIHMEEDAGKLVHDPWSETTLCDYNRCGVPLMEIVTQPDLRSAEETIEFLQGLKRILEYAGVTDGRMHEGSLRTDLNISVRKKGDERLGTRTEMKNMNSFKAIFRAVNAEALRQVELIEKGEKIRQETRRWDDNRDKSSPMRSKEDAQDYRYFPEPDLPSVVLSDADVEEIARLLPELPRQKMQRYASEYGLPARDVAILCQTHALTALLEETIALGADAKQAANWIIGDVLRLVGEKGLEPSQLTVSPRVLAQIIRLTQGGTVTRAGARLLLEEFFEAEGDVEAAARQRGLLIEGMDEDGLEEVLRAVLAENADAVQNYKAGKTKALSFLSGQCMKQLKGRADPRRVTELLEKMLG